MSIRKNVLYNSALTLSGYIFPLIIFPYISRVLGVTNIGICDFVDSIINYYILFSMMGMAVIGMREIAKSKAASHLSKTFSELFTLNLITTFIVLIVFLITVNTIPRLCQHQELMYIGSAKIIFNLFLIEWLYKGLENFRYITFRTILVKFLYVITIFLFVRHKSDYNIYYLLTVGAVGINAAINWIYGRKYVCFNIKGISLKTYAKTYFMNGLYLIMTSMYSTFNIAFLGFISTEDQVGYYTTSIKLYSIFTGILTAFTHVMIPRMAILVSEKRTEDIKAYLTKSFALLFAFGMPLIFISVMMAPEIIYILAGDGYDGAILPAQIMMPLILIIGIAQILVLQILFPNGCDKAVFFNSVVGATVSVLLNILIVRYYLSVGAAIVVLAAEFSVTVSAALWVKKYYNFDIPYKSLIINLLSAVPYIFICIFSRYLFDGYIFLMCLTVSVLSGIYYVVSQIFILKNQLILENIDKFRSWKKSE